MKMLWRGVLALVVVPSLALVTVAPPSRCVSARRTAVVRFGGRKATPLGRTSRPTGKAMTVEKVVTEIDEATLMFAFDGSGLKMKAIDDLRKKLPETAKAKMVKNTLMKRAGE